MKVSDLTMLMLIINSANDTGEYQDISIAEVWKHIDEGDLIPYLRDKIGDVNFDRYDPVLAGEINKKMIDYLEVWRGQEYRKGGVKNSGLCLLLAILINMTVGEVSHI